MNVLPRHVWESSDPKEIIEQAEWTWWSKVQSDSETTLHLFQKVYDGSSDTNMIAPGRLYDAHAFLLADLAFVVTDPKRRPLSQITSGWTHFDLSIGDKRYYTNAFQLMKVQKRLFPWGEELLAFSMCFDQPLWMPKGVPFKVDVMNAPLGMAVGCALHGKLYRPIV